MQTSGAITGAIISTNYSRLKRLVAGLLVQKAQERLCTAKAHNTVVACESSPYNVMLSGKARAMANQHFGKDWFPAEFCRPVIRESLESTAVTSLSQWLFAKTNLLNVCAETMLSQGMGQTDTYGRNLRDSRQKEKLADTVMHELRCRT